MLTIRPHQIAATIILASLATSAYFFAQGTTSLVASKLFGGGEATTPRRGSSGPGGAPVRLARRTVSANAILERNIFEPPVELDAGVQEGGVETPPPVLDTTAELARLTDGANAPACGSDVRILGAMINPALPSWSYAALTSGQASAILYRPGSQFSGKTVALIDSGYDPDAPLLPGAQRRPRIRAVLQDPGGTFCQVTLFQPPAGNAAAAAPTASVTPQVVPPGSPAAPAAGGDLTAGELDQGITRVSDTQFNVRRDLMTRAIGQQESLFRSARLIPNEENGSVNGMKVYGIRRSSMLGRLGLQNGDVLSNVNGQTMTTADALMQAYSSLGSGGNFSIGVVRRGQPVTLTYQVQ